MFDIIGDIHGHADQLHALLNKLGYHAQNGSYHHPGRQVIFVGDYIDRGPQIPETLAIVRHMTDAGDAIALMGNHEFNALCFHEMADGGGHLRRHNIKHILQHKETLEQFKGRQQDWESWLDWFRTLPLFYENAYFRAVHACWDDRQIQIIAQALEKYQGPGHAFLTLATDRTSPLYFAIEDTLKGKEIPMPEGLFFHDKDGNQRSLIRIKWWEDLATATYKNISVIPMDILPDLPLPSNIIPQIRTSALPHISTSNSPTSTSALPHIPIPKPTFFGHYWLQGNPILHKHNICCLDYSVAKGGKLVAYRFNGEAVLDDQNFVHHN